VHIDQSGCNDETCRIQNLDALAELDRFSDPGNPTVDQKEVTVAIEILARINHSSALDQ
jgi:hypothetical protein